MTTLTAEAVGGQNMQFDREVLYASRSLLGARFFNHGRNTSCRFKETMPDCMENGLGPKKLDCSGVPIVAICSVLGISTDQWAPGLRHVRQMATYAEPLAGANEQAGQLLIFKNLLKVDGRIKLVPTHVGILENAMYMIHAQKPKVKKDRTFSGVERNRKDMLVLSPSILAKAAVGHISTLDL